VHGFYTETEVVVDLYEGNKVALANRKNAIRPPNAKKSNVKKILDSAADNVEALVLLWEMNHGKS
jgi:hypothetical protein